jgi:FMN phosphatase YigB (HAD superfamily)
VIEAVLFDLDDTLIGFDSDFAERYLSAASAYLRTHAGEWFGRITPEAVIMKASGAVTANLDPDLSNYQVFDRALQTELGAPSGLIYAHLEDFHRTDFEKLSIFGHPTPVAARLIQALSARNFRIAIATNPLSMHFGTAARLTWSGVRLPPETLVTTMENSHFTKPHLQYYEEVLSDLGVRAAVTLMVGNSWDNDMVPARQMGMYSFWVSAEEQWTEGRHRAGSLADLERLVGGSLVGSAQGFAL